MIIFSDNVLIRIYKKWQICVTKMQVSATIIIFGYWFVKTLSSLMCMPPQKRRVSHLKKFITLLILLKQDLSNKLRTYFECPRHLVFRIFLLEH